MNIDTIPIKQVIRFSVLGLTCRRGSAHLVIDGPGYIQMSLAAHHRFIVAAQQLQRVPQVAAGFRLAELVADCPEISADEKKHQQSKRDTSRLLVERQLFAAAGNSESRPTHDVAARSLSTAKTANKRTELKARKKKGI